METMMRMMNSFWDVMSSMSTQILFRTSTRSGSMLDIFMPTTTQSQDMTSVTNAVGLKQLCTLGNPEQVSAVVLYFQVTFFIVDEGKSMSLVYMLCQHCAERKPVIWYDGLESYIFVDDGVYKMAPDFHFNEFKIFMWTLVDSDQAPGGVPPELIRNRTHLFVLYASS